MDKQRAFLKIAREATPKRPVGERVRDFCEVETDLPPERLREQAARCMDCGIPFCHQGCPLGNHVPDWNELVYSRRFREASERLHATNNFPEFTGRICPAPCEDACVLEMQGSAVTIRQIEKQIVDHAFAEGWIRPRRAPKRTGKRVAVIGSGPGGLACAQELARAGHEVTVFERDDRIGGLLRYGIPDFKMEKVLIDRRVAQMRAEGVRFVTRANVGSAALPAARVLEDHDATVLAVGALAARELPIPGRELDGVHLAMDYLTQQNRLVAGDPVPREISAAGKRVVILGGGDTGADCLGTAHRQGAREVHHFHYKPPPPDARTDEMPWPHVAMTLRPSSSHEEGGVRDWSVLAKSLEGENGRVQRLRCVRVEWDEQGMREVPGSELAIDAELVLIAIGFAGPERSPLLDTLGVDLGSRGTIRVDARRMTSVPSVFACGDATRGASLVVWAIQEGRETARAVHEWLTAKRVHLPTLAAE